MRKLSTETFQYRKVMLNGKVMQHADMIVAERNLRIKETKEQSQAVELNKRKKKEMT